MMTKAIVASTRRQGIGMALACLIAFGCSPKMDWRDVRQESAGWKATFPGKPVEVSRKLALDPSQDAVLLTLKSARIDEVMYAVGWIDNANPDSAQKLQQAMLANIQAAADSIRRDSIAVGGRSFQQIKAQGLMRTEPAAAPVPAKLWLRTLEIAAPAAHPDKSARRLIEIIVVGPVSQFSDDDARQFLDSLQLL